MNKAEKDFKIGIIVLVALILLGVVVAAANNSSQDEGERGFFANIWYWIKVFFGFEKKAVAGKAIEIPRGPLLPPPGGPITPAKECIDDSQCLDGEYCKDNICVACDISNYNDGICCNGENPIDVLICDCPRHPPPFCYPGKTLCCETCIEECDPNLNDNYPCDGCTQEGANCGDNTDGICPTNCQPDQDKDCCEQAVGNQVWCENVIIDKCRSCGVTSSDTNPCNGCCGNGRCESVLGETAWNCPEDCGAGCTDECTSGSRRCSSNTTYQICGNYDSDTCTEWSSSTSCSSGQVCQNGSCVTPPSCTPGTSCGTNGYYDSNCICQPCDADSDSYNTNTVTVCNGNDCNDNNASINPGKTANCNNTESSCNLCNSVDDDCDTLIDEGCEGGECEDDSDCPPTQYCQLPTGICVDRPQCSNTIDDPDPEDILIDMVDPGCAATDDNNESDSSDYDEDGCFDSIDDFPSIYSPDSDSDGYGDDCDNCILVANPTQADYDNDTYGNVCDNCPDISNPGQEDSDNDGIGDACEGTGCQDECTPEGSSRCNTTTSTQTCGNYDQDICLEWSTPVNCPSGYTCSNGSCISGNCTPGNRQECYTGPAGTLGVGICRAGNQTCNQSGQWGECIGQVVPTTEICDNGLDDDCDSLTDDNDTSCVESLCGNGVIEPGEQCEPPSNFGGLTCQDFDDFIRGTLTCNANCIINVSACTGGTSGTCGNGIVNTGEQCDGNNFGGLTCQDFDNFTSGPLSCTQNCIINTSACLTEGIYCEDDEDCERWEFCNMTTHICEDRAECNNTLDDDGDRRIDYPNDPDCTSPDDDSEEHIEAVCGNNIIEIGEECDGNNFGPINSCTDFDNFTGGILSCIPSGRPGACHFNTSACTGGITGGTCGDGTINVGEECDGNNFGPINSCTDFDNFTGGILSCIPSGRPGACHFNTSACTAPECNDFEDNDNDGRIDYPADLSCINPNDNTENTVCGDNVCESPETCRTCRIDCGSCGGGGGGGGGGGTILPPCDRDKDGYVREGCISAKPKDCNDNDSSINPGAEEICDNRKDDDCDKLVDEGCKDEKETSPTSTTTPTYGGEVNIDAEQFTVNILSIETFTIRITNNRNIVLNGQVVLDLPPDWSYDRNEDISLNPGETRTLLFKIAVPAELEDKQDITVRVIENGKTIANRYVQTNVVIPIFIVKVRPKIEGYSLGEKYEVWAVINNKKGDMDALEIETDINKGLQTLFIDYYGVFGVRGGSKYRTMFEIPVRLYQNKNAEIYGQLYSYGSLIEESKNMIE